MASEKQIAANRHNALRSTGPRTKEGKARSRMNALRHGLASAAEGDGQRKEHTASEGELARLHEALHKVALARLTLFSEVERLLLQPPSEDLDKAVRRLGALQRHAARHLKELKRLFRGSDQATKEIFCRTNPIVRVRSNPR